MNIFVCKSLSMGLLIALGEIPRNRMIEPKRRKVFQALRGVILQKDFAAPFSHQQLVRVLSHHAPIIMATLDKKEYKNSCY